MLKIGDTVLIKKYKNDERNKEGIVHYITDEGKVWVANLNMPYSGNVSEYFDEDELILLTE